MASSWVPEARNEFGRIDKGYRVKAPDLKPDSNGDSRNKANAYLQNRSGERVWMWVNGVTSDFAMAGTTAQSKKRRSFFPHNFTQPVMTISCQNPNQFQAARLAEFIRLEHKKCILNEQHFLTLAILAGGEATKKPIVKGHHDRIVVDGYVQEIQRGSERFINAPDTQFTFIITRAHNFLGLHDQTVRIVKFKSILDVITKPGEFTFEKGGRWNPPGQDHPDGGNNNGGGFGGHQRDPGDPFRGDHSGGR